LTDKPQNTPETITGRRDFDVVTFADYSKDMDEQAERTLAMHQHYRHEIKEMKTMLWNIVRASGGKVAVDQVDFRPLSEMDWTIEKNDYDMKTVFKVKDKT